MSTFQRSYNEESSSWSDKILSHPKVVILSCGLLLIFFGFFSFALGVAALCVNSSASFIGYGLWCGILFIISGIVFIFSSFNPRAWMVTLVVLFGLVSVFLSIVQFSLGVRAAKFDGQREKLKISWGPGNEPWDLFGSRNVFSGMYCTNGTHYGYKDWMTVDILLLLVAIFTLTCSLLGVIMGSWGLCAGSREFLIHTYKDKHNYTNKSFSEMGSNNI